MHFIGYSCILEYHAPKDAYQLSDKVSRNRNEMHTTELKQVKQEKDIGVIVDDQLKFESHILEKIKKANNIMGLSGDHLYI